MIFYEDVLINQILSSPFCKTPTIVGSQLYNNPS